MEGSEDDGLSLGNRNGQLVISRTKKGNERNGAIVVIRRNEIKAEQCPEYCTTDDIHHH